MQGLSFVVLPHGSFSTALMIRQIAVYTTLLAGELCALVVDGQSCASAIMETAIGRVEPPPTWRAVRL